MYCVTEDIEYVTLLFQSSFYNTHVQFYVKCNPNELYTVNASSWEEQMKPCMVYYEVFVFQVNVRQGYRFHS